MGQDLDRKKRAGIAVAIIGDLMVASWALDRVAIVRLGLGPSMRIFLLVVGITFSIAGALVLIEAKRQAARNG